MLTVLTKNINIITQKIYEEIILDLDFHTIECPKCSVKGQLRNHAYYKRKYISGIEMILLRILRVICKGCRSTHAVLLDGIVPYSAVPLNTLVKIIEEYVESREIIPTNNRDIALKKIFNDTFEVEESNIRYIFKMFEKHFEQKLQTYKIKIDNKISKHCFKHLKRNFMQVKKTINLLI